MGEEESVDGASMSAGRHDVVESPERTPEEQIEEVRGEAWRALNACEKGQGSCEV